MDFKKIKKAVSIVLLFSITIKLSGTAPASVKAGMYIAGNNGITEAEPVPDKPETPETPVKPAEPVDNAFVSTDRQDSASLLGQKKFKFSSPGVDMKFH